MESKDFFEVRDYSTYSFATIGRNRLCILFCMNQKISEKDLTNLLKKYSFNKWRGVFNCSIPINKELPLSLPKISSKLANI